MESLDLSCLVTGAIASSAELKSRMADDANLAALVVQTVVRMRSSLLSGGRIWFCGNGGSAADAQHLAAELSGRFYLDRRALPAEALHCNTSYLTAVANDYSYDAVYSRLIEGMGRAGDVLVGLSTSGNSKNVVEAFVSARKMGIVTIGMTGADGGVLLTLSDICIRVPSIVTPRIQEGHMLLGHAMCEALEASYFADNG